MILGCPVNCWKNTRPSPMISRRHMFDEVLATVFDDGILEPLCALSFLYEPFWFELSIITSVQNERHGMQVDPPPG